MRILVFSLLIGLVAQAGAQADNVLLDFGTDSGGFGETVSVPVTITVTGTAPSSLVFRVNYDLLKLAYQSFQLGPVVPDDKIVSADLGPNGVVFGFIGGTSQIQSGLLMTLRFTVLTPVIGVTSLVGSNGDASTPDPPSRIPVSFDNGRINLGSNGTVVGCPGTKTLPAGPSLYPLPEPDADGAVRDLAEMPGALGSWEIVPQEPYDTPREVLLPLAPDSGPVEIYLFDGAYTWWAGETVEGWLAAAPAVVRIGDAEFLRLAVLHGGVVAIAPAASDEIAPAGVLPSGDGAIMALLAVLLVVWRGYRRAGHGDRRIFAQRPV